MNTPGANANAVAEEVVALMLADARHVVEADASTRAGGWEKNKFMGREITIELIRESLKDLLALQDKLVSIDNIQRTTAEYYKIKISDLLSKRRSRSVARPRQVAMALSKELTNHSLPEIGDAFGGRDHTTVLHACRKIAELRESDADIREDYKNLLRTLTT